MDGNRQDTAPVVKVASAEQQAELSRLNRRISVLSQVISAPIEELDAAQQAWEADIQARLANDSRWQILVPETFKSDGGAAHVNLEDRSILVSGENPTKEVYEITALTDTQGLRAIRLEGLTHPSLDGAAGRSSNGNVVLTEFELEVAPAAQPDQWTRIKLANAWADHEQTDGDFKVGNAIDGKAETGWATGGHQRREDRTAIFLAESEFGFSGGTRLRVRLRHESPYGQHQFGRIRLAVTSEDGIPQMDESFAPAEVVKLITLPTSARTEAQRAQIKEHYRMNVSQG